MDVHVGGPVETGRGFVLHSSDYYAAESTLPIDDGVSLTATVDILKAIAGGKGPDRAILALGYAGWRPGQLESEIAANGWLHCPADVDLLFDRDLDQKYERALSKIGIDPSHLVSEAGPRLSRRASAAAGHATLRSPSPMQEPRCACAYCWPREPAASLARLLGDGRRQRSRAWAAPAQPIAAAAAAAAPPVGGPCASPGAAAVRS